MLSANSRAPQGGRFLANLSLGLIGVAIGGGLVWAIGPELAKWMSLGAPAVDEHDHAAHDDHAAHGGDENRIKLSPQARKALNLKTDSVKLTDFERSISVPGMVAERRGKSRLEITAPLTGVVTKVFVAEGEAVAPGDLLFEMRLTHEELVQSQADLLKTAEQLDVIRREVKRLEEAAKDGAVAAKTLLERQYELQKEEASLRAQKQAMLLHGLSIDQVEAILKTRELLRTLTVSVPHEGATKDSLLQVLEIRAERGRQTEAGAPLAVLVDHAELLIEGEAFERDAAAISSANRAEANITAVTNDESGAPLTIENLRILYVSNQIDVASRTQHFYVVLPNEPLPTVGEAGAKRYIEWKYKPGRRMQLRVPVERWTKRIVLPIEAVAQEGAESYVFRENGENFDRQAVHVEHRDALWVVIAADGSLFPGESIALNGAQQLQLAVKNKSGPAIDPHAGHTH